MYYRDDDIHPLDENKLAIARYDTAHSRWVPVPSTCYPNENKVVARINHLSTFALIGLEPSWTYRDLRIYPNPFSPTKNPDGMIFENVTANTTISLYNVAGEMVRKLRDPAGSGLIRWDGRNESGNYVGSGVYIAYIVGDSCSVRAKLVVER
jgi:hypothetical protein